MDTMPETVETVFFGGMGEPLAHPDILTMVAEAKARGKQTELLTNATLLTADLSSDLLDAGLGMLWVSIDSLDAEGYEHIRAGSSFELIRKNISLYNGERARRNKYLRNYVQGNASRLGLTFVVMKSNVDMLSRLADFAARLHVDEVNVSNLIPTDETSLEQSLYSRSLNLGLGAGTSLGAYPRIDIPFMDFSLPEVRGSLTSLLRSDINLAISGVPISRNNASCRFIEDSTCFVRHDGDISPCMALLHSARTWLDGSERIVYHHSFGNLSSERLDEVWRSDDYTSFRNRVRNFEFSPCLSCGGCDNRLTNEIDCIGNVRPTCGACLWSEGIVTCP
jgi:MoaA/NifB/PqqE/SkfB family radical SAM enzyme